MNCRGVSRRLSVYIDNDLSPGIKDAVDEHLQSCLSCKRRLSELEAIVMAAHNMPSLSISDGFSEKVLKAVNARQETQEVLGAIRYKFTIAGVAFMVTSAAVFFLIGPPSTDISSNYSGVQDSIMLRSSGGPDFYTHPETKVTSFPVPDGALPEQVIADNTNPKDSATIIEEFIVPDIQQVKENVSGKH